MFRINLELDGRKKTELGLVVAVLGLISYLVYANWDYWTGHPKNQALTVWVESHPVPVNITQPLGKNNPADPSKKSMTTVFANHDGKLELLEIRGDTGCTMAVKFTPDSRRNSFLKWQGPADPFATFRDTTRRVLAFYAYNHNVPGTRAILTAAELTRDQRNAEADARNTLKTTVTYLDNGCTDGTVETKLYQQLVKALEAYRAQNGDPSNSGTAKAARANDVMDLGLQYLDKIQALRLLAIKKYVETVYTLLDAEQKQHLIEAAPPSIAGTKPPGKTG